MATEDVHEERELLRSLLTSDFVEFKRLVTSDGQLAPIPHETYDDLIEGYLRRKYGNAYAIEK